MTDKITKFKYMLPYLPWCAIALIFAVILYIENSAMWILSALIFAIVATVLIYLNYDYKKLK